MAGPYTIATPTRGQPVASSAYGQAVKDAINDLHLRTAALEQGSQAVIAWGRRTTTSNTSASSTEVPVLRIDAIPVKAGCTYQVNTGPIFATSTGVSGTPSGEGTSILLRYATSTLSTVQATTSSNKIGHFRIPLVITQTPTPWVGGAFTSTIDGFASVLLGFFRNSGSGTHTLVPTASDPLDMFVQYGGVAPSNTGVVL
jgi:hypothetical protein